MAIRKMIHEFSIGKIETVRVGMGGYDDAMFGVSFTLCSIKDCWSIGDFKGTWASPPDKYANWTVDDQTKHWGNVMREMADLLKQASVSDIQQLVGKPVEVSIENGRLKSWRLLTEAL